MSECPNCHKQFSDEDNKLCIENTGMCLSCDSILLDGATTDEYENE